MGRCPFHDDRTPSLVITPAKNLWHCLGSCQTGGSVIDWVMKSEGVSFRHAVELLRQDHPALAAAQPQDRKKLGPKLEAFAVPDEPDGAVLRRVVDYYRRTLKQSPEALEYLKERGLSHPELVEHFKLGFSNRTLAYRLPPKVLKHGAALRGQLQRLGVLRASGHEHFNGSVVIPVFDADGVVEMYGRKITARLRKGTPLHLYLPGPHRGVFNHAALAERDEVILCESLFDALSFWCAGFRHVTASYGVEGFTSEHLEAFKRHEIGKVLIAYDRDEAGDRAAAKLAPELSAAGMSAYRVEFPHGMDANEYACKVQPATKSLETVVRAARWLAGTRAVSVPMSLPEPAPAEPVAAAPPAVPERTASSFAAYPPAEAAVAAPPNPRAEVREGEVHFAFGGRRWRIRGLAHNTSAERLKVNVHVRRESAGGFHIDTLELYSARHRLAFIKEAAHELQLEPRLVKSDLGQVLLELEQLRDAQLKEQLAGDKPQAVELSEAERKAALELLCDPKLIERIVEDFERAGVVGERSNKLLGYLAAVSRKLEEPLAIVIQSSSAAGKSSLMEAVLSFVPPEERVQYSAMTGQSLFYMGETDLQHKILAIAEEEGAQNASYALKLLQSEGELTIASTGKDPQTGRHVTQEYRVQGPVMLFLTTTAIEVDEELLNRCIVLTVDEGPEQTRAIHTLQRKRQTLEGLLTQQERGQLLELHHNAQRLLRPLLVANPFAMELRFADHRTRTRRDHMKYLTLMRAVALLYQHQRPIQTVQHQGSEVRYIEVTQHDIDLADQLLKPLLQRSLEELPPGTRKLLGQVEALVRELSAKQGLDPGDVRFSRPDVRQYTGVGHTQLKVHLRRLEELEYLHVRAGGERKRLVYSLNVGYDTGWAGLGRPQVGPEIGGAPRPDNGSDSEDLDALGGPAEKALFPGLEPTVAKDRLLNGHA